MLQRGRVLTLLSSLRNFQLHEGFLSAAQPYRCIHFNPTDPSEPAIQHNQTRSLAQPAYVEDEDDHSEGSEEQTPTVITPSTRRSGIIAVKAGMTQDWDEWGARVPLTVLWIDDCQVIQVKTPEREGYLALQLGCGSKREKQVNGRELGHYAWAGVPIKRHMTEFRITEDAKLPVGHIFNATHFVPGQYVDVQGTTSGKGFQGVMKKHGFAGQPASHGNSKAHRAAGGIGACQDPGKVWPGKKMPGRMGGKLRTVACAYVYKVDAVRNLLYLRGQVPGHKGNFVKIKDAVLKTFQDQPARPVPTFLDAIPLQPLQAQKSPQNPFE